MSAWPRVAAFVLAASLCGPGVAAVVVRDDAGRTVSLERPARRIVSLAPHVTELLYEVGAGDRVVGATAYSDYPAAARDIPRVGGLAGLDVERIVALKPDLVIAWQSGTSEAEIAQLARIGLPVYRSEPHTLDDVATTIERFGVLTGHVADATTAAASFRTRVAGLRATYGDRSPVRVFYQVWNSPLMTVGGSQLTTQLIELCGGRNVFASLPMLAPIVDAEAVIKADPQVIATASDGGDHRADLATWARWPGVTAVREKRFVFLDPALVARHTSRVLIGAETLCRAIDAARH